MIETIAGRHVWVTRAGQGAPRVFVHCSLGVGLSLAPLAKALPPARDVFFDLPGHGKSAPWAGSDYASDVLRVVEGLVPEPAHLVGHSFGATVALRMAAEAPDRVSRLTLIEPVMFAAAGDTPARERHIAAFAPFVEAWDAGDMDRASRVFMAMWGGGSGWDDLPEAHRQRVRDQIHLVAAAAPAIEEDVHGVLDRLRQVTCPVDLIEGGESQPIMSALLDGLQAGLPNCRRTRIDGAGHMVPITHPAEVARAMAQTAT